MANKSSASTTILALMFFSLLVIYVIVPQNDLVTFLSVVIMAIGLIIGVVGDREEVMMMAGLAAIISLLAAYFWGQSRFGLVGSVLVTVVWGIILFVAAQRASADTVVIPEDHAYMIAPFLSQHIYPLKASASSLVMPFLDRHIATIPTYELTKDTHITEVNLVPIHNVTEVAVLTRYRVVDPSRTLRGIPNRGTLQNDVAKNMAISVGRARLDVAFWEKLLSRQMGEEVEDIVRRVLFKGGEDSTEPHEKVSLNLEAAYKNRTRIADMVERELQQVVQRWGVKIHEVTIDFIKPDKDVLKGLRGDPLDKDLEKSKKTAEMYAVNEAQRVRVLSEAESLRMRNLIKAVKEAEPELNPEAIKEIVVNALLSEGMEDYYYPNPTPPTLPAPPAPSSPADAKKP